MSCEFKGMLLVHDTVWPEFNCDASFPGHQVVDCAHAIPLAKTASIKPMRAITHILLDFMFYTSCVFVKPQPVGASLLDW